MKDGELFSEVELCGTKVVDCELVYESKDKNYRLYRRLDGHSFLFKAVLFSSSSGLCDDYWLDKSLMVETIFQSIGYYDGVRHLEFNRTGGDSDGYLYYPDMDDLIEMLSIVRETAIDFCRNCAGEIEAV